MLEADIECGAAYAEAEGAFKDHTLVPTANIQNINAMTGYGKKPPEIAKALSLGRSTVYCTLKTT